MKLLLAYVALLGATVSANYCVQDKCGRAVFANSYGSNPSLRKADCSSFFRYTSYPPPKTTTVTKGRTTVTTTKTVPQPGPPRTSTVTLAPTTQFQTITPSPVRETTTLDRSTTTTISTFSQPPTTRTVTLTAIQDTITTTETETERSTTIITVSTVTTYYSEVNKRGVTTVSTKAVISSPTRVPAYASDCHGPSGYSSACSCLGVKKTTVKGPCSTKTVTVSSRPVTSTRTVTTASPSTTITAPRGTSTVTTTAEPETNVQTVTPDPSTSTVLVTQGPSTTVTVTEFFFPGPVTTTETRTETDVSTNRVTATRAVGPVCSQVAGETFCGCEYQVVCGQVIVGYNAPSYFILSTLAPNVRSCIALCDGNVACRSGQFDSRSGVCILGGGDPSHAPRAASLPYTYFERNTPNAPCGLISCGA